MAITKSTTKLYELKKGSKIYASLATQVGTVWKHTDPNDPIIFDHLDGMYSYCYLKSDPEVVVHISASAPLYKYKDGWKLGEDGGGAEQGELL